MKKHILSLTIVLTLITFYSCSTKEKSKNNESKVKIVTINEVFQSPRDENDNIDSPTFWSRNDTNWVISTAKDSDFVVINNAINGDELFRFGKTGNKPEELKRPNGISVHGNYLFIVERDNKRVQVLTLPNFKHIGFFAENDLKNPYGLFIDKSDAGCKIYITDDYRTIDDEITADSLLNERVLVYSLSLKDGLKSELISKFGETTGSGKLKVVESIFGDRVHNNLLIAEEEKSITSIKVYTMDGKFKKSLGDDIFKAQVEGIALYKTDSLNGYWFITDQSMDKNIFHVFDRVTLKHIGGFIGKNTLNTDGIWLTQNSYSKFKKGAFFAIHDDGNVSGFDLSEISDSLNLEL